MQLISVFVGMGYKLTFIRTIIAENIECLHEMSFSTDILWQFYLLKTYRRPRQFLETTNNIRSATKDFSYNSLFICNFRYQVYFANYD